IISIFFYFTQQSGTAAGMYVICAALGFSTGFWAIFVTMAAEQFGTNLRATAATTVPNMVRGALPLMILLFKGLQSATGNYITAGWITGVIVMVVSLVAAWFTDETFGKELNYVES
ncbi:MAG: MFS transporter, partial [Ferruginibacter sp.]